MAVNLWWSHWRRPRVSEHFLHTVLSYQMWQRCPWAAAWHRSPVAGGALSMRSNPGGPPLSCSQHHFTWKVWGHHGSSCVYTLVWIWDLFKARLCFQMWPKIERPERGDNVQQSLLCKARAECPPAISTQKAHAVKSARAQSHQSPLWNLPEWETDWDVWPISPASL